MRRLLRAWAGLCLAGTLLFFAAFNSVSAADFTWTGAVDNSWTEPGNWDCGGCGEYPGQNRNTDNVTINIGSVTLDATVTVNDLDLSRTLSGVGQLAVDGTFNWTGNSSLNITTTVSGTLNLSGNNTKNFAGTLTLQGTTNHLSGSLNLSSGDVVNHSGDYNHSGGVVAIGLGGKFNNLGSGEFFTTIDDGVVLGGFGTFENDGLFRRTGGSDLLSINCVFQNDGTFDHATGNLLDLNGDFFQNGTLQLNGSEELETNNIQINQLFTLANGQLWDINGLTNLTQPYTTSAVIDLGGTLNGVGPLIVDNQLTWRGSVSIEHDFTIATGATLILTDFGTKNFIGTATLQGTTDHQSGSLNLSSGDVVNHSGDYNHSGGLVAIGLGGKFNNLGSGEFFTTLNSGTVLSGSGTFENDGLFRRTGGGGPLMINCVFQNDGTFHHATGSLLDLNGDFFQNGTLQLNGSEELETNNIQMNQLFTLANGQLWDISGFTNLTQPYTTSAIIDLGGTLNGTGPLTVNNQLTWRGSVSIEHDFTIATGATLILTDFGTKNFIGTATLQGTTDHQSGSLNLSSGDVVNHSGDYNHSGGLVAIGLGGKFNNLGSGEFFTTLNSGTVLSGSGTFENDGLFRRTGGGGPLMINCVFQNDGTFHHATGSLLDLNGDFFQNGTLQLNGSEELETNNFQLNQPFTFANGQLWDINGFTNLTQPYTTSAVIDLGGTLNGTGPLTVNNQLTWRGSVSIEHDFTIATGATLILTDFGTKNFIGTATLQGTTNHLSGTLSLNGGDAAENSGTYHLTDGTISLGNSNIFTNSGTFTVDRNGTAFGGSGLFDNAGDFRAVGSANSFTVGCDFDQDGILAGLGTINFTGTFTQNGTASPGLSTGILTLDELDNTNGTLLIELAGDGAPGTEYDQLNTTGPASLGGTLQIEFLDDLEANYEPQVGDQFTIMTCDPCSGAFAQIIHPGPNPNAWSVSINTAPNPDEVILTLAQALPVTWLSFTATPTDRHVALHWQTSAERDNRGFTVQRSPDGKQWTDLGFVSGAGDNDGMTDYRYRDEAPLPGTSFYRLQQEDWDGTIDYSPIRSVRFAGDGDRPLASPNPFVDELWLRLPARRFPTQLQLYDAAGNLVLTRRLPVGPGGAHRLKTAELPAGTYFVQLDTHGGMETIPVVKTY